jgi:hypothetical protein
MSFLRSVRRSARSARVSQPDGRRLRRVIESLESRRLLSGMTPSLTLEGTINVAYSSYEDSEGRTHYTLDSASADVDLTINVPLAVPISVRDGALGRPDLLWNDPTIWDNPALVLGNAANLIVSGTNPGAVLNLPEMVDIVRNLGPTSNASTSRSASPQATRSQPRPRASIDLKFDVTIPSGADVIMNQSARDPESHRRMRAARLTATAA